MDLIRLTNDVKSYPKTLRAIERWIKDNGFTEGLWANTLNLNDTAYSFEGKGVAFRWGSPPWYTFVWVRHAESGKSAKFALWHSGRNPIG